MSKPQTTATKSEDVGAQIKTILEEYGYDIVGVATDEDTNTSQKLEENTQVTTEATTQILQLIEGARVEVLKELDKYVIKTNCDYGTAINRYVRDNNLSAQLKEKSL